MLFQMSKLVLTRKMNQEIVLHDSNGIIATIAVVKLESNQVRLAFDANQDVFIDRKEVYNKKTIKRFVGGSCANNIFRG